MSETCTMENQDTTEHQYHMSQLQKDIPTLLEQTVQKEGFLSAKTSMKRIIRERYKSRAQRFENLAEKLQNQNGDISGIVSGLNQSGMVQTHVDENITAEMEPSQIARCIRSAANEQRSRASKAASQFGNSYDKAVDNLKLNESHGDPLIVFQEYNGDDPLDNVEDGIVPGTHVKGTIEKQVLSYSEGYSGRSLSSQYAMFYIDHQHGPFCGCPGNRWHVACYHQIGEVLDRVCRS